MILAEFVRGPYDGHRLFLPAEEPWPEFVIPQFEPIVTEFFYYLAGELYSGCWAYLYGEPDL